MEYECSDCGQLADKAYRQIGMDTSDLFLCCKRHPAPLWVTISDEFEEVDINILHVLSIMES